MVPSEDKVDHWFKVFQFTNPTACGTHLFIRLIYSFDSSHFQLWPSCCQNLTWHRAFNAGALVGVDPVESGSLICSPMCVSKVGKGCNLWYESMVALKWIWRFGVCGHFGSIDHCGCSLAFCGMVCMARADMKLGSPWILSMGHLQVAILCPGQRIHIIAVPLNTDQEILT